ncbi:MAG: phospholipase D-like domain-containing protein [Candidatus Paceibacterota bacterium]
MFSVFHKVHEVWEAQLEDIERATSSILMEQYIMEDFDDGGIGRRFIDALIHKQQQGVEVRCIVDALGSFELFKNNALHNLFTDAGGKIFYYKNLGGYNVINPARLLLRDHRKLLLVDRRISWIGGVVVGERFRDWDDLMVRFESEDIADVLNKEFRNQLLRLEDKTSLLAPLTTIDASNHISGNAPGIGNRFCYEEICHAIMRASESVMLVTPYFAPPTKLRRVLNRRLSEGLSITLLTPQRTDHHIADLARESYMKKFLKKGLILQYAPHMIHAKIVIVDGVWMTFGSTNLDGLSLIFNHELNMTTRDADLIKEVQEVIKKWNANLKQISFSTCEFQNQSRFGRLIGRYCRLIT